MNFEAMPAWAGLHKHPNIAMENTVPKAIDTGIPLFRAALPVVITEKKQALAHAL